MFRGWGMSDIQLDSIRALSVNDGDVLVLKTTHPLSAVEASRMRQQATALMASIGKRVQAIIVDPSVDVDLITDDRAKRIRTILDE